MKGRALRLSNTPSRFALPVACLDGRFSTSGARDGVAETARIQIVEREQIQTRHGINR